MQSGCRRSKLRTTEIAVRRGDSVDHYRAAQERLRAAAVATPRATAKGVPPLPGD